MATGREVSTVGRIDPGLVERRLPGECGGPRHPRRPRRPPCGALTSLLARVNAPANDWCLEDAAAQAAAIQRSSSSCQAGGILAARSHPAFVARPDCSPPYGAWGAESMVHFSAWGGSQD